MPMDRIWSVTGGVNFEDGDLTLDHAGNEPSRLLHH